MSELLAHRGFSRKYPENTLLAVKSALELGACNIEVDVHLSKDQVPVVIHDARLQRTCAVEGEVHALPYEQLAQISAHYPQKFGDNFLPEPIPSLSQLVELIQLWPQSTVFVEIKRACINHFGIDVVLQRVLPEIEPILSRCVLISFDPQVPRLARHFGANRVGWVFEGWSQEAKQTAAQLQVDFLLTDYTMVPHGEILWPGPWQWVLYAVDETDVAVHWLEQGAHIIETNDIELLLACKPLGRSACNE
ncbi:MAG: glycerophosphodiester phosphodiesterase family protein [Gammaproteobacteria bacterium]|nr:glycerophosphodiester phosphodiesterase family protein [Gammaproteobacteria bacterium]MDH5801853.1 glycerophosphodiester phosphodiesterase family protein [Gammaproteobacteria bacterium]